MEHGQDLLHGWQGPLQTVHARLETVFIGGWVEDGDFSVRAAYVALQCARMFRFYRLFNADLLCGLKRRRSDLRVQTAVLHAKVACLRLLLASPSDLHLIGLILHFQRVVTRFDNARSNRLRPFGVWIEFVHTLVLMRHSGHVNRLAGRHERVTRGIAGDRGVYAILHVWSHGLDRALESAVWF